MSGHDYDQILLRLDGPLVLQRKAVLTQAALGLALSLPNNRPHRH